MTTASSGKTGDRKTAKALIGGTVALGLGGLVAAEGLLSPVNPALADAVRVEAPQAPSFADVVEAVSPAVVSVRVEQRLQNTSNEQFSFGRDGFGFLPDDHPLRRFFDRRGEEFDFGFGKRRRDGRPKRHRRFGKSQGSGFFVSEDGYLVTNNHVIEKGAKFTVVLHDGTEMSAKLIGSDSRTDLAVLKVEPVRKFTYVEFSDVETRIGDWVVAVGNPFGLGGTRDGRHYISARTRSALRAL